VINGDGKELILFRIFISFRNKVYTPQLGGGGVISGKWENANILTRSIVVHLSWFALLVIFLVSCQC
jgi:hypothetical protein